MPFRRLSMILALWAASAGAAAASCGAAMPAEAARLEVPGTTIDAGLLDAAFRVEINRVRCARGLAALDPAEPLIAPAAAHSRWMAGAGRLTHDGRRDLAGRLRASGLRYRTGAENIGQVQRYRLDGGAFRVEDAAACRFSRGGEILPPHSYASLARHAVALWMASPGHRRNILDSDLTRVAHGASVEPDGPHCGRIWMTQIFAG